MTECCPNGQCERLPENRDIICEMNAQRAEIERLRAALQRIVDNKSVIPSQTIATLALRGVAALNEQTGD